MKSMLTKLLITAAFTLASGTKNRDWLIHNAHESCSITEKNGVLTLTNGLISRIFTIKNNLPSIVDGSQSNVDSFGTTDYISHSMLKFGGDQSMFRAISPEAEITLDGITYNIGGLTTIDGFRAYCNRTNFDSDLRADVSSFTYLSHEISSPVAPFPWIPGTRGSIPETNWPPKGCVLSIKFVAPSNAPIAHRNLDLQLHYSIFDNHPVLSKWMTVSSNTKSISSSREMLNDNFDVVINSVSVELFAANAGFGSYIGSGSFTPGSDFGGASSLNGPASLLQAKTDQAHSAVCRFDSDFANSRVNIPGCPTCKDEGASEPILNCTYTIGPGAHVNFKESFLSFKVFELVLDSTDLTRQALSRQRLTNLLAPHTTENPIFFHATNVSEAGFIATIDAMVETGFEMLIYSFGTVFIMETNDTKYLDMIKGQVDYARTKGIEVGGYDLIDLDRGHDGYGGNVGDEWCVVSEDGKLSVDACFASGWSDLLYDRHVNFIEKTGLAMVETDGPYGGDICTSTTHNHHHGKEDSVYRQTQIQNAYYNKMRELNVFVNQPDDYFFQGGSKTGMGYNENQYSLPKWRQLSVSRAGLYDDLYVHTPTQGWMFVPLDEYHSGGEEAYFNPLHSNLDSYEMALAQYIGAGVAACYRGASPYDSEETKQVVNKWTSFYKRHRHTLIQPIVHMKRPDMQSWDGYIHVNPFSLGDAKVTGEVGIAMLFNPLKVKIDNASIYFPLYYTGLTDDVLVKIDDDTSKGDFFSLDRDYGLVLTISIKALSQIKIFFYRI